MTPRLLALAALVAAPASAQLQVQDGHFVDAQGGVVLLRGVGVSGDAKVPPFSGITSPAQLDPLVEWGLNVIRLVFIWEAYEPTPGGYDQAYLDAIEDVVDWAWERGIAVVLDFHQDGFSRHSIGGCGDGFPDWAIPWWIWKDTPDNGPGCSGWATAMAFDLDMHASWQAFHADSVGARSAFLAAIGRVAQRFASHPGLLGYDLLNEPWGDEPGEIAPLYADAAAALRAEHPGAILFVSPHASTSVGLQTNLPPPGFGNFAYSPHFYDPSVHQLHVWLGNPLGFPFSLMAGKAGEWDAPLFLGEFGAPADTVAGGAYVDALYAQLDQALASGTQWNYTPGWTPGALDGWNGEDLSVVDDQGALRPTFRVRSYARRIAGTPTSLSVEDGGSPGANHVELVWEHEPAAGTTEIFLPRALVFGSKPVVIETEGEGLACAFDAGERFVLCSAPLAGSKRVRVRAKQRCGLLGIELGFGLAAAHIGRRWRRWRRSTA